MCKQLETRRAKAIRTHTNDAQNATPNADAQAEDRGPTRVSSNKTDARRFRRHRSVVHDDDDDDDVDTGAKEECRHCALAAHLWKSDATPWEYRRGGVGGDER